MATQDLTTLDNVNQWLGLTSSVDDQLINRMITAYSHHVQAWLSRDLLTSNYTEFYDGTGSNRLLLANYPVTAVSSVTINGDSIPAAATIKDQGYRFTPDGIVLTGYRFYSGMGNITVSYTAGFATTPPEVEQAVIDMVGTHYREKDRIGNASKTLAGEVVSFDIKDMPAWVKSILIQFRRVTPL